jgi:hypothetical protein
MLSCHALSSEKTKLALWSTNDDFSRSPTPPPSQVFAPSSPPIWYKIPIAKKSKIRYAKLGYRKPKCNKLANPVKVMKLLSTFYSTRHDLAPGWWATIEYPNGQRVIRHLWQDTAGPDFDDLAAVVADLSPIHGLDRALQMAREDPDLVRRTKPVAKPLPSES